MAATEALYADVYAVLELCVALHKFVNVEMRSQGWYAVRVKLLPHARIKAVWPYTTSITDDEASDELASGMEAAIGCGWSWRSHVFRIQYCSDKVALPEPAPCFQVFLRQPHQLANVELLLELELLAQTLSPSQLDMPYIPSKMRTVSKEFLRIQAAEQGVLSYTPVTWGVDFWGMCHISVATCLVGYATRAGMHSMGRALGRDLRRARGGRQGMATATSSTAALSLSASPASSLTQPLPLAAIRTAVAAGSASTSPAPSTPAQGGSPDTGSPAYSSMGSPLSFSSVASLDIPIDRKNIKVTAAGTLLEALQAYAVGVSRAFSDVGDSQMLGKAQYSSQVRNRLEQLYNDLVMPLKQCTHSVSNRLKVLPTSCWQPQTYDAMRALLQEIPPPALRAFSMLSPAGHMALSNGAPLQSLSGLSRFGQAALLSSPVRSQVTAASRITAPPPYTAAAASISSPMLDAFKGLASCDVVSNDVASWPTLPEPHEFLSRLPVNCTPGGALLYLHAILARLMQAAATEWTMLQWLLQHSTVNLLRYLRCCWELEQPEVMRHWVVMVSDLPQTEKSGTARSSARVASHAHAHLLRNLPALRPQVSRCSLWDHAHELPVLVLDDRQAAFMQVQQDVSSQPPHRVSWAGADRPSRDVVRQSTASANGAAPISGQPPQGIHLVVFVHGYKGSPIDLGPLKAHMHAAYPSLECRFSVANKEKTSDSLDLLGARLAEEVLGWVADLTSEFSFMHGQALLGRLSFVGHSMGAIIIRTALANPKMAALLPHLWMMISIGAPLLGQLYNGNKLLSAGVGMLTAFSKGSSLQQLDLGDVVGQDPSSSILYRVAAVPANCGGALQLFRRVVLIACEQDGYVPAHSAQLASCAAAQEDTSWRGKAFHEMLSASTRGFGQTADSPQLLRVGVHFPSRSRSSWVNDVLGRTAHVLLIESDELAQLITWGVIRRYNLMQPEEQAAWLT